MAYAAPVALVGWGLWIGATSPGVSGRVLRLGHSLNRDHPVHKGMEFMAADLERRYEELPAVELEGHPGQIANFLDAIDGREPLLVDGQEARRTLELVAAIYQSGQLERKVTLPLQPTDPFYTREGILKEARHFHEKTRSVENFSDTNITLGGNYGK